MSSWNLVPSLPMACFAVVGFVCMVPMTGATAAGPPVLKVGERASNPVVEVKNRRRSRRLYLPIAPSVAYDYPYYYARGFYPKHVGRGYVYYGQPYAHYKKIYRRRCSYRGRRCIASTHLGSRRQRRACRCR
jgi:hypothetical protein